MKTRNWFWATCLILTTPAVSHSQTCVDPQKTKTYDTVVVGSGNAFNTFTFPKFDPALGTLMSVNVRSEITLLYGFELENREPITISNYRVRVFRDDEVTSSVLATGLFYSFSRNFGPYLLTAWDGIEGSGTDYRNVPLTYVVNHSIQNQTLYNTADFLGLGDVSFDYTTSSYSTVLGSVNYHFNPNARDTVHFSITYTYCPSWFLKADLSSFTVIKSRGNIVNLQWTTQNETPDRHYEIQQSLDGRNFITIGKQKAQPGAVGTGNYGYSYTLPPTGNNRQILFRLKEVDGDGTVKYSPLRIIPLQPDETNEIRLFPNPATTETRIVFSQQQRSNWEVQIISLNGALLKNYSFQNTSSARLEGLEALPRGVYIVKATNRKTQEVQEQKLIKQ